ncbi:uncharacterized protein LOC128825067 isoform X2 [Malaclemys terrapin pileata]|uniref:uncharacterized protein LOC128825067 isoform X2 n=1 Tax=Malaclemys terrapin pileata TaxID=2991368 RepID=UPI0023A8C39D|nr:uncharacterized protein LOC128825067 isoform X2 [Malaclemys terrapin pileata]
MGSSFPVLLSPDPQQVLQAVQGLVAGLHKDKGGMLEVFLGDAECEEYLGALCSLLAAPKVRLCSNVAYILGTIAEKESGAARLVALAGSGSKGLLDSLSAMLTWDDPEAVMNAAGTLGSLAETGPSRRWLLQAPKADEIIEKLTALLGSADEGTASNAALVLARITGSQEGCVKLLGHPHSQHLLRQLITSLTAEEAGCSMNAAFTLGRLCDTDLGLQQLFALPEVSSMIHALVSMMASAEAGGSRNACFALSCLAANKEGHDHVLQSPAFPRALDTLCRLLRAKEQESSWFAAMTLRVLASQPKGVMTLREHPELEPLLQEVAASETVGEELLEEVTGTLAKLRRLPKPPPPEAKVLDSGSIQVAWESFRPQSSLEVNYRLYEGGALLYRGPALSYAFAGSGPCQEYCFQLCLEARGDRGPCSDVTVLPREEPVPSCPLDFRVTARMATQLKVSWAPPAEPSGPIKHYTVYREETLVGSTPELSCVVGGLAPAASYRLSVCACTSKAQGEKATLLTKTMSLRGHAPERLTLVVLGRSEIFVTWDVPKAPLGRFFNYELCLNGEVVYLGTARSYMARRLRANTAYTCTVSALTSAGRCVSQPVTKRTPRDEYSDLSRCHYPSPGSGQPATASAPSETPEIPQEPGRGRGNAGESLKPSPARTPRAPLLLSRRASKCWEIKTSANPAATPRREPALSCSRQPSQATRAASPAKAAPLPRQRAPDAKSLPRQTALRPSGENSSAKPGTPSKTLFPEVPAISVQLATVLPLGHPAWQSSPGPSAVPVSLQLSRDLERRKPRQAASGQQGPGYGHPPVLESLGQEQLRAPLGSQLLRGLQRPKPQTRTGRGCSRLLPAKTTVPLGVSHKGNASLHPAVVPTRALCPRRRDGCGNGAGFNAEQTREDVASGRGHPRLPLLCLSDWLAGLSRRAPQHGSCQGLSVLERERTWRALMSRFPAGPRSFPTNPLPAMIRRPSGQTPQGMLLGDHLLTQARAAPEGRCGRGQLHPLAPRPQRGDKSLQWKAAMKSRNRGPLDEKLRPELLVLVGAAMAVP